MVLLTTDVTRTRKLPKVHHGPVFDVIETNFTAETHDTRDPTDSDLKTQVRKLDADSPPSVHLRGRGYIRIHSRAIINALQSVVNHYPHHDLVSQPVKISWPYALLVHHWDELKEFREAYKEPHTSADAATCSMDDTYKHLGLLLEFLEAAVGEKVRAEKARWEQPEPKASFEMLWLLLRPGVDVYDHIVINENELAASVVSRVSFEVFDGAWESYNVETWCLGNDANAIRPHSYNQKILRFHGEKPIHELDIFPCHYHGQHEDRKRKLIERGRLAVSLTQRRCMYFDGESAETPRQLVRTETHCWM